LIITAGKYKGKSVKIPKTGVVRPTSAKVRESIFNIIQLTESGTIFWHGETIILDMFAGSGIMGIEALSRGAKDVVFIEKDFHTVKILHHNISKFTENIVIIHGDSLKVIERFDSGEFNFIFIDPPYLSDLYEPAIRIISKKNILTEGGILVLEHSSKFNAQDIAEKYNFQVYKSKIYGDTGISILKTKFYNKDLFVNKTNFT
jgi:16S rRNA (guanine966-N2)-methyltransferase